MSYHDSNETYWDDLRNDADDIVSAAACRARTKEENEAYWDALSADLDNRANNRLGKLPDNSFSAVINSLLALTGDDRADLIDKYNDWLFDLCLAVEKQKEKSSWR
ncbi:MAG: hypothetical protein LBI71_10145 [Enterobacteriaceae bacterium]|jgi:hypothetical protein|nr:hypothetical protein [Enterobacteriaceae bacterium]